jgi:hypothetical protein
MAVVAASALRCLLKSRSGAIWRSYPDIALPCPFISVRIVLFNFLRYLSAGGGDGWPRR